MDTSRDDDFTFSKVSPPDSEVKDLASDVGSITLKDGLDQQKKQWSYLERQVSSSKGRNNRFFVFHGD